MRFFRHDSMLLVLHRGVSRRYGAPLAGRLSASHAPRESLFRVLHAFLQATLLLVPSVKFEAGTVRSLA